MTKLGSQHLPLELDQQRWHVGASGGTWRSNPEPERQRTAPTGSFHLLPESRSEMGLEFWCDVSDISKSCQMLDQPKWRGTVWRNNTFGILRKLWVVPGKSWHQKAAGKVQPWSSLQRTQTSAQCPDVARPPSTGFHGFFAAPFAKFQVRSFCVIPGNRSERPYFLTSWSTPDIYYTYTIKQPAFLVSVRYISRCGWQILVFISSSPIFVA